jgi:hypothetical protein
MGIPKFVTHYGEWAIDEVVVKIISQNLSQIIYKKYEQNAERRVINITVGLLDRWRGFDLETKTQEKLQIILSRLNNENTFIRQQKELQKRLNKVSIKC